MNIAAKSNSFILSPEAKKANADVIVTIGGGSLTDGAKVVRIALETGVTDGDSLGQYCFKGDIAAVKDTKLIPQALQLSQHLTKSFPMKAVGIGFCQSAEIHVHDK